MNKRSKVLIISLSILFSSSCISATDKTLSPPTDTKWVNVEVKNPSRYTKPFPLEVVYTSHQCMKKRISGFDGSLVKEPSYNGVKIPLQQQGSSDIWRAKVAMSGGGSCGWTLSEFNLGIEYIDATHLGKDLVPGTAVGATIAFDDNASRNGQFDMVDDGNLTLSPIYYPLIKTNKMVHKIDTVNLFGEEDFLQKRIVNVSDFISIIYSPKLDESKIVKMIAPREYKAGAFYKIIYPDGAVVSDGSTHPDIKKLMK